MCPTALEGAHDGAGFTPQSWRSVPTFLEHSDNRVVLVDERGAMGRIPKSVLLHASWALKTGVLPTFLKGLEWRPL